MKLVKLSDRLTTLFAASGMQAVVHCATLGALGMILTWSPAAHAVPTLSPAENLVVPATLYGLYVNVVTGEAGETGTSVPGWDINPWASTSIAFFSPSAPAGGAYVSAPYALNLAVGTVIGPDSPWGSGQADFGAFGTGAGVWALNATNTFGFRFIGEDALLHYGYGTMIVGATPAIRSIGQMWYESAANTPISVVPEPASLGLMLFGGLALAGAMSRRRRLVNA